MLKTHKAHVKCFKAAQQWKNKRTPVFVSRVSEQALDTLAKQSMKKIKEASKEPAIFVEI
ncbi:hypothetical protein HNR62_001460 [Oceanisphaera litoralis]|uniref:hypothetical protein n=1 Tax=Oceanisphaera litoralis TaxID=225144 RepID=UPI00195D1680|nr:hypothetical protein [Oceanisphaera litoralis]MBM7455588.1 hypothetical protein [Oceanisphaera litoralis]